MSKDKLPELKSKPIIGVPEEEWSKWSSNYISRVENLLNNRHTAYTEEVKEKRASFHRGKKRSEEFKKRLSEIKTGKKIGHVPSKFIPVIATNIKTGEVLEFEGQVLAAEKLNLNVVNISSVLKGRQATTGGYTFSYKKLPTKE